jgi:mitochondrial ornithine carrier protein
MHSVYQHQGIAGFWHGQLGTLIREMGGSAAWFGSYEGAKLLFLRATPRAKSVDDLPVWQRLVAGAVAGMSYNLIFYPADTIKSRMQTQDVRAVAKGGVESSFWAVGKALWASQGVRGLYRGCGITVGRAAPSSAVIFTVYEMLREHFA